MLFSDIFIASLLRPVLFSLFVLFRYFLSPFSFDIRYFQAHFVSLLHCDFLYFSLVCYAICGSAASFVTDIVFSFTIIVKRRDDVGSFRKNEPALLPYLLALFISGRTVAGGAGSPSHDTARQSSDEFSQV